MGEWGNGRMGRMGRVGDGEMGRWGEWEDWGDLREKECILLLNYLLLNQRWGN